jgi:hypothetical protein
MTPLTINLSAARLNEYASPTRTSPRPPSSRQECYAAQYDWFTLFYDVFWSADEQVIHFLAPSIYGLENVLRSAIYTALPSQVPLKCTTTFHSSRAGKRVVLISCTEVPKGTSGVTVKTAHQHFYLAIQPNLKDAFSGKRCLLAIQRNNHPQWIVDWASFHASAYGINAVLIYDNGSTDYSIEFLETALATVDSLETVAIVPWLFPYGPAAAPTLKGLHDSSYAQIGMLNHARFRFLANAEAVLNLDIDELLVANANLDVHLRQQVLPHGQLHRFTIENITDNTSSSPLVSRHCYFHHWQRERRSLTKKWILSSPDKVEKGLDAVLWHPHNVYGADLTTVDCETAYVAHFNAITTGWKHRKRLRPLSVDCPDVQDNRLLKCLLDAVFSKHSPDFAMEPLQDLVISRCLTPDAKDYHKEVAAHAALTTRRTQRKSYG